MKDGIKFDLGKPPVGLLDPFALSTMAQIMSFGSQKYGRFNWRNGLVFSRFYDAALRHIFAFIDGEDLDPESGLPHLGHAMCNLMFLLRTQKERPDFDDRYRPEGKR